MSSAVKTFPSRLPCFHSVQSDAIQCSIAPIPRPSSYLSLAEEALVEYYVEEILEGKKQGKNDVASGYRLPGMSEVAGMQLQLVCDVGGDAGLGGGGDKGAGKDKGGGASAGGFKPLKIRDINSEEVEKLVLVSGIVTQCRPAVNKVRTLCLQCQDCMYKTHMKVREGLHGAKLPSKCGNDRKFLVLYGRLD